ncbi:LOW QUALITY PROTEIN: oleosin 16 kDa, partial [Durio zibethinus]|uniref:LOW QUALITY PROTEIN: oleosin 16 kDa n=1 Tax=Durio zibethinus TaxID=66656 RepID=A0A6P5WQ87_DURZI
TKPTNEGKTGKHRSIADGYQKHGETHNVAGRSMICASPAAVAVVTAPPQGISSPLLLVFSPLLLLVGLVFAGVLAGFADAAAMALAGVSTLAWMYREVRGSLGVGSSVTERLAELGERVKEQGKDWTGYLQQQMQENSSDTLANRV